MKLSDSEILELHDLLMDWWKIIFPSLKGTPAISSGKL